MATATAQEQQWAQQNQAQAHMQRMAAMIPLVLGAQASADAEEMANARMANVLQKKAQVATMLEHSVEEPIVDLPVREIRKMIKQCGNRFKILGEDIQAEIDGTKRNILSVFDWANAGATDATGVATGGTLSVVLGFFTYPVMIILGIVKMWQYSSIRYSPERGRRRIARLQLKALHRVFMRALVGILKIIPFISMVPSMSLVLGWEEAQKSRHDEALQKLQKDHNEEMYYFKRLERGEIKDPHWQLIALRGCNKKVEKLENTFDAL